MDILCHALESYTARWYADFDAKQPEQRVPYCGANPIADMWSEKALSLLAGAFRTAVRDGERRARPASRWRWPRPSPGSGFGNAGVHIPHANAYPIAGRVRDYRPEGYPDDEPIVPHGMAVSLTAPEAFRFTFDAAPERHLQRRPAARPRRRRRRPRRAARRARHADARHRASPTAWPRSATATPTSTTWSPAPLQQQRLLATAPREVTGGGPGAGVPAARWNTGDVTADAADLVAELRRAGRHRRRRLDPRPGRSTPRTPRSTGSSRRSSSGPRHADELAAILDVARATGVPVTMRGAGTSIAGNAVGPGIVVDTVKHLNRVLSIDPEARTAVVQPGVVHADLQRAAAPHGLRFGPDPSTHTRCTIGGMIGNNACGSRALGYGRTADNVRSSRSDGRAAARAPADVDRRRLGALVDQHLGARAHRRSAGSAGRSAATRWSTCCPSTGAASTASWSAPRAPSALVLEATVRLVADEPRPALVVLGYPSMAEAADAVPGAARAPRDGRMIACEGLDARIVDLVRAAGSAVPELPRGAGWLFVEVAGDTPGARLARVVAASGALGHRVVADPAEAAALWRIREDGAGLAARSLRTPGVLRLGGRRGPARAARRLAARLRRAAARARPRRRALRPLRRRLRARADRLPASTTGGRGVPRLPHRRRAIALRDARRLAVRRARRRPGPLRAAAADVRRGVAARSSARSRRSATPTTCSTRASSSTPAPLDADLRPARPRHPVRTALRLVHDGGSLGDAVHRCTGVGKCVAADDRPGVMCPSYLATRDEKDSTRGRARVLQEALDGSLVDGLARPRGRARRSTSAWPARAARRDCPTGVDMATYKAEALHQKHDVAGERRPRSHYLLGRLPKWARLAAPVAPAGRTGCCGSAPIARLAKATAGIDQRRVAPGVRAARRCAAAAARPPDGRPDVWIWADSFTDHFFPGTGHAAIRLPRVGRPDRAGDPRRRLLRADLGHHRPARPGPRRSWRARSRRCTPYVESGVPVVGLEPSCLATLRSDAVELTDDPRAAGSPTGAHLRRAARPACDAAAARPHRRRGRRAAALPPRVGPRLGRRRGAARAGRRDGDPGAPAAAGWPATSAWRRATTRSRSRSPRRTCCRPCAPQPGRGRARRRACPAGSSSTTWRSVPAMHLAELLASETARR